MSRARWSSPRWSSRSEASGSWHSARRRTWASLVAVVPPFLVFSVLAIVVSLIHADLFSADDASTWGWFAFFGVAAAATAVMLAMVVRDEPFTR